VNDPVAGASPAGPVSPATVLRPEVLALSAYHVADARGMVKLDAMENPHPLPEAVREAVARRLSGVAVNRYPDAACTELKQRLRDAGLVPDGAELLLGNGSDEIIQLLALAVARPGAVILGVEPSFVMFRMLAVATGARWVGVPLRPDFGLDEPALLEAIDRHRPALAFLAYPNNPTGNLFDRTALERAIARLPGLAVVDEAYHAFAGDSFAGAIGRFPNVVVMRTLSKLGLAGLRLGYLMGPAAWIGELDKLRLPYNINSLTQAAAAAILEHSEALDAQAASLKASRTELAAALARLPGVAVFPSAANFLLLRVKDAPAVFAGLKQRGVLVKLLDGGHPLLAGCLRVTVSTPAENRLFLDALAASLVA
jgi:histidinol-phosphate aminotransferase